LILIRYLESLVDSPKFHTYKCDVTNRNEILEVFKQIKSDIGKIDILINNAGIISGNHLLELSPEQIEATVKVNLLAHFWMIKQYLPDMLADNDGQIVTIASQAGIIGSPKMSDYCATKFAVRDYDQRY